MSELLSSNKRSRYQRGAVAPAVSSCQNTREKVDFQLGQEQNEVPQQQRQHLGNCNETWGRDNLRYACDCHDCRYVNDRFGSGIGESFTKRVYRDRALFAGHTDIHDTYIPFSGAHSPFQTGNAHVQCRK